MTYPTYRSSVHKELIEKDLLESLQETFNLPEDKAQKLFDNLKTWVDAKLEEMQDDTIDRVERSGRYDPNY